MVKEQIFFLVLLLLLSGTPLILHALRTNISLGPFFGLAGVYSILLWQMLQTGWWVSFGELHFNAGLTSFIPAILMGSLLTFALDGLRTCRSYFYMVMTACLAAWLFALFRENLAQYVPLPYLVVLSGREHFAIITALLLAQIVGAVCYVTVRKWRLLPSLPVSLLLSIACWLWLYSLINYGAVMGTKNVLNELDSFLLAALPVVLGATVYGRLASSSGLILPQRSLRALLTFWRPALTDEGESREDITNRDWVISEVKLLNRAQKASNQLMEYHMLHAPYGIVITDAYGQIRRNNEPAARLLRERSLPGCQLAMVMGRLLGKQISFSDITSGIMGRRWKTEDSGSGSRWLDINITPLMESDSAQEVTSYYILVMDETEAVREESRKLATSRIRDLNEAGKVLTHDFSNLLIGAQAQLRRLEGKSGDRDSSEALKAVSYALNHARELLKQLGAGSQFGMPSLRSERIAGLLEHSMEICRASATEDGVSINVRPDEGMRYVYADASQMTRVFTNLIRNAVRACAPNGTIDISVRRKGAGVEVLIADNGRGMSDAELGMAFEPGFSTRGEGKGGLGLAISYLMVDAHGGTLELQRNPSGRGILASVWLPESHCPLPLQDFIGRNVIVASHFSGRIAPAISQLETQQDCSVAEAYAIEEVVALLEEPDSHWDLVLLDEGMDMERLHQRFGDTVDIRVIAFQEKS